MKKRTKITLASISGGIVLTLIAPIIFYFMFILFLVSTFHSCNLVYDLEKEKTDINDYSYIYEMVEDHNKGVMPQAERNNLFGYGEYLYNSYLGLTPREQPSTLGEFYYYWMSSIDVDYFAIYYTCELNEESYDKFVSGLDSFEVTDPDGGTRKLIKDTESFDYTAYIIQWIEPGDKWETLEYYLLDEENHTVIFVYTMGSLGRIEENSSYNVSPKKKQEVMEYDFSVYQKFKNDKLDFAYGLRNYDDFEYSDYDNSFVKYLE